jgi:hypothetical protein
MTWQAQLIRRYPNLFLRSFRGVAFAPGFPRCDDGWQDVVTRLVERVATASSDGTVYFTHIVAEHGALRVHWSSRTELAQRLALDIEEPSPSRRHAPSRRVQSAEPRAACSRATSASLRPAKPTNEARPCRSFQASTMCS